MSDKDAEGVVKDGAGAPKGNENGKTHGLFQSRERVWSSLSDYEKQFAIQTAQELLDRLDDTAGTFEHEAVRNIVLDQIKRSRANDYILANDIDESARMHQAYSKIVNTMTKEMGELGLKIDTEKERAISAEADWFEAMTELADEEE